MRNAVFSYVKPLSLLCLAVALFSFIPAVFAADDVVAHVEQVKGEVTITRGAVPVRVAEGAPLKVTDTVTTAGNGSVGLRFLDETTISLGPDSKMAMQDYAFEPDKSRFAFVTQIFNGSASYVSGLIAKLSPESVRIITPSASIGVRGTQFAIEVDPR